MVATGVLWSAHIHRSARIGRVVRSNLIDCDCCCCCCWLCYAVLSLSILCIVKLLCYLEQQQTVMLLSRARSIDGSRFSFSLSLTHYGNKIHLDSAYRVNICKPKIIRFIHCLCFYTISRFLWCGQKLSLFLSIGFKSISHNDMRVGVGSRSNWVSMWNTHTHTLAMSIYDRYHTIFIYYCAFSGAHFFSLATLTIITHRQSVKYHTLSQSDGIRHIGVTTLGRTFVQQLILPVDQVTHLTFTRMSVFDQCATTD